MKRLLARLDLSYLYAFISELTLGLTFVFYILIARTLGPERYEIFAAAVALGAILALFIQFGLPFLLNREVAANPSEGSKLTVQFLLLEVLTSLPVLLLLFPIAKLLGYENNGLLVCYIVVLAEVCRAMKMTLRGALKGMGWFRSESVAVAIERFSTVTIASAVLLLSENLVWLVVTIVIVRSLDIIGLLYYLSRKLPIWSSLNPGNFLTSLRKAYPFAISGILWIVYYQVDVVMLKGMAITGEAGFYSASYRILEMFLALPRVIFQVVFTRFAQYHANEPEKLPEQVYKAACLLLTLVLPAIVVAGFLQIILVKLLYGDDFSPAVATLGILLPSVGMSMFGNLAYRFLMATGKEATLPPMLLTTTLANVVINAILIPRLGGVGAAIATLVSEVVLCLGGLILMSRTEYAQLSQRLGIIAFLSVGVAAVPSFIVRGFSPMAGIGLMLAGVAALVFLMRPRNFLGSSHTQSPS